MTPKNNEMHQMSVLLVDDNSNTRIMLKKMLGQIGFFNILDAADGYQALDIISKEEVNLILCDWNMPKMKGGDILRQVRQKTALRNTPVLLITGEVSEKVLQDAAESEVDDYLLKPFTVDQLRHKVRGLFQRRDEVLSIDQHLARGSAFAVTRQFSEARKEFMAALKINPGSARTLYEVAALHRQSGNGQEAQNYLHRALENDPKFLKAAEDLAELYEAKGDTVKHIRYLQKAVEINPRDVERRMKLADLLLKNQQANQASAMFHGIMQDVSGQYSDLAQRVGQSLLEAGDFSGAEAVLNKALDANPGNLHLFNDLGIAYRKQGKIKEAVANYKRALEFAPENVNLFYNLARAHYESGDKDEAARVLKQALHLKPEFKEAAQLLVMIQDQLRDIQARKQS
jgi:CheY-like chemotaxis protein